MIHIKTEVEVSKDERIAGPNYLRVRESKFSVTKPKVDGVIAETAREFVISRSAVAGIVHCPSESKILMLRQFRYPVYHETKDAHLSWIYETVAGLIDDGDTPMDTFVREVKEETGIEVTEEQSTFHTSYYVSPGFVNEKHFIFSANVSECKEPDMDAGLDSEGEAIAAEWLTYKEISDLIKGVTDEHGNEHKIVDGKTLMALMAIGFD